MTREELIEWVRCHVEKMPTDKPIYHYLRGAAAGLEASDKDPEHVQELIINYTKGMDK